MVVSISAPEDEAKRKKIVDRYGELDVELKRFGPQIREHKALGETIRSWFDDAEAASEFVANGFRFDVQVSARPEERQVFSYKTLYRILRKEKFLELATITLKLIERNVPENLHHRFLTKAPTGSRRLQAVSRSPIASGSAGLPSTDEKTEVRAAA